MQILIVHHDVEVGEQLVQMVKEYTEHLCGFAVSDRAAIDWARGVPRCSLLITQLQGEGVNGLRLGATLSETFAGLQTMFLPEYASADQRLDVPQTKVFPEPIDGERLLNAIAVAEERRQTGMDLFHALDLIQMCCLSGRSGALQLVKGSKTAVIFLLNGQIIHAERGAARGAEALYEIVPWEAVEFAYDYSIRAPVETVRSSWHEAVIAAVGRHKAPPVVGTPETIEPAPSSSSMEMKPALRRLFGGSRKVGLLAMACQLAGTAL